MMLQLRPLSSPGPAADPRVLVLRGLVCLMAGSGAVPPEAAGQDVGGSVAVRGQVVDRANGRGVDGAEVVLQGTPWFVVADDRGRFRLETLRPGRYVFEVHRIGYHSRTDTLDVPEGVSLELTFELSVEPIPLAGIEVVTRSLLLESRGFYDRQRQGFRGFFLDRPAIEKRDPLYVTDLFRNIPGVDVVNGAFLRMSQSVTLLGGGRGCEPSVWLDGIRSNMRNYDFIRPDHIEGVEVYTGGGAPGKYNDLCGTVVIWTRVTTRRR